MIILALVVLGLCLGSFVNALVWRLYKQQRSSKKKSDEYSIVHGRSMCSHCKHPLSPVDLVPLLSWLWLRGKCRYCQRPIEDTPLPEVLVPVLLVASYAVWPQLFGGFATGWPVALFAVWALILTCFVALTIYDARWFLLPDRVVWPLTGLAVVFVALRTLQAGDWTTLSSALMGAAVIAGLFWGLELVSKGAWIGHGDVKLGLSLGLLAGGPVMAMLVIFVASLLGTVYVLAVAPLGLLRTKGKSLMKAMLPFGPFLIAATFFVVLWGESIKQWYTTLFLV